MKLTIRTYSSSILVLPFLLLNACGGDFSCADTRECNDEPAEGVGGARESEVSETAALGGSGGEKNDDTEEPPPFGLLTSELPPGRVNVKYEQQLEAEGSGKITFEVDQEELPQGMDLTPEGLLFGTPLEEGVFTFQVTVTNEKGDSETVSLTLTIVQKRWLAFVTNEGGQERLKVLDYSLPSLPQFLVSLGMGVTADVKAGAQGSFEFSENGSGLAYLADKGSDGLYGLYLVDTSGTKIAGDDKVSGAGLVTEFSWSPDGKRIAFIEGDGVYVYDLETEKTHNPGDGDSNLEWLDSDMLTYSAKDGASTVGYTRYADGKFSASQQAVSGGSSTVYLAHAAGGLGYFAQGEKAIGDMLVDFDDDAKVTAIWSSAEDFFYSPELAYLVGIRGDGSIMSNYFTYSSAEDTDTALFSTINRTLRPLWSPDNRWMGFANGTYQLQLVEKGQKEIFSMNTGNAMILLGDGDSTKWGGFSPDARWIIVADTTDKKGIDAVSLWGDEPKVVGRVAEGALWSEFSPNSKYLAYQLLGGKALRLSDMSGVEPKYLRQVSTVATSLDFDFSSDSAALAYIEDSPRNLYVVNVLDKNGVGSAVTQLCADDCGDKVLAFEFQP